MARSAISYVRRRSLGDHTYKADGLRTNTDRVRKGRCCSFSGRIPGVVENLSKLYRPADMPGLVQIVFPDRMERYFSTEVFAPL